MHKTEAGERRKALKAEALELARVAKAAVKAAKTLPEVREKARELEGRADELKAEAEALKGEARLEDLAVWVLEKVKPTKKGSRKYSYWMATWRESSKTRNVHIGSCMKLDREAAMRKARAIKKTALGMDA